MTQTSEWQRYKPCFTVLMNLPPSQLDVLNPASACSPLAAEAGSPTGTTHSIKRSSEGRWQLGGGAETETEAVWSVCMHL